jgi:hypothetical protein
MIALFRNLLPQQPLAALPFVNNSAPTPEDAPASVSHIARTKRPTQDTAPRFPRAATDASQAESLSGRLMIKASLREARPPTPYARKTAPSSLSDPHRGSSDDDREPRSAQPHVHSNISGTNHAYDQAKTPPSASRFDDVYLDSRRARYWGLQRPEDEVPAEERRHKKFRLAPATVWLRTLNTAVTERDYAGAMKAFQETRTGRIESAQQLEALARCSVVQTDWRTLAVLLGCSKRHIESDREVLHACRDVLVQGIAGTVKTLSAQQVCAQLMMCSAAKLPRSAYTRALTPEELVVVCRNDDVVSLALAAIDYCERGLCVTPQDFGELQTQVQVAPSRLVHACPLGKDKQPVTRQNSYVTPPHTRDPWDTDTRQTDEDVAEYYASEVVPQSLNGRFASLFEFACMVGAPRCAFFLTELASGRLALE